MTALHQEGSSYYYFERQLLWLFFGSILFVIALRTDYPRLRTMRHRSLTGTGRSDGFASGARADLGGHRLDGRRALPG